MHDDRVLVEKRIERELWQRVLPHLYRRRLPLTIEAWDVPGEPVPYAAAVDQEYRPFAVGQQWGRPWGTTWFRLSGDVPEAWVGDRLEAVLDLGWGTKGPGSPSPGGLGGCAWAAARAG